MNYRIVEENRQIWIEEYDGKKWVSTDEHNVPRYHLTVDDARSWVKTLQRGKIIHSVEDAPNLTVDERKAGKGTGLSADDRAWIFSRDIRC